LRPFPPPLGLPRGKKKKWPGGGSAAASEGGGVAPGPGARKGGEEEEGVGGEKEEGGGAWVRNKKKCKEKVRDGAHMTAGGGMEQWYGYTRPCSVLVFFFFKQKTAYEIGQ